MILKPFSTQTVLQRCLVETTHTINEKPHNYVQTRIYT
jgi:hypothetical protein